MKFQILKKRSNLFTHDPHFLMLGRIFQTFLYFSVLCYSLILTVIVIMIQYLSNMTIIAMVDYSIRVL